MIFRFVSSPNFGTRARGATVNAIVLHATADGGDPQGAIAEVTGPTLKSYHAIVERDGTVDCLVLPDRRAWHAGVSALDGVNDVNQFSIGIALANKNDGHESYPLVQLDAAAQLCVVAIRAFPSITLDRIVSHAAVALPPGRKNDPLGLDVATFRALVASLMQGDSNG